MLKGRIFQVGDRVFVKKTLRGEIVEQAGTVTSLRATSGNGQMVTVEIESGQLVEAPNVSDYLTW